MLPTSFTSETFDVIETRLTSLSRRRLVQTPREAAVLVPFCTVDGEASVLFTKRSDTVGTHKGQVSFPGGMADDDDESPVHTALREAEEELGIARSRVRVHGLFHDARAITGIRVVPVIGNVGEVGDLSSLIPSQAEIDHVFALSLRDIVDPAKRSVQTFGARGTFPVFEAGPFPVWGLTAYILAEVMTTLFDLDLLGDDPPRLHAAVDTEIR